MNLFDIVTRASFEDAVAGKLITIREDGAGLRILNYSDAALYTPGAWDNPAVRVCRGIIVDADWEVRARPWAKFFNHGQAEAGELDMTAPVEVTDKLDGSLGIIHRALDGAARVASRGSFESDQARHATDVLRDRYPHLASLTSITPLVEIIYPGNRIVVDYGDADDLVLLGGVVIETGEYLSPHAARTFCAWPGPVAKVFEYATLRDALAAPDRPGMEGLCVRYLHEPRIVKIKRPEYVALHKIVTGLSERTVWEHMSAGKPLEGLLAPLPDELHDWTRGVWTDLTETANRIHTEALDLHLAIVDGLPPGWSRKDYAERANAHPKLRPYLFNLLDGRSPRAGILRTLKPVGDTRARAISEAVA